MRIRLPYFVRQIKWFVQRGIRGWADCDWWNMDSYVSRLMIDMIDEMTFKGCHVGCGKITDLIPCIGDSEDTVKEKKEARRTYNLYRRMKRFFEIHLRMQEDYELFNSSHIRRLYKASGLLFIRNFGRLWD